MKSQSFNNSSDKIKYFGINNESEEILNNNVEVAFFEYGNNEYAVKLNTKENEDVILYRTNLQGSFENLYNDFLKKSELFSGEKKFTEHDQIQIPYINIDAIINYEELCNKAIKGTNGVFIANALQTVKFNLNESGGGLSSETSIKPVSMSAYSDTRDFNFNSNFIIFLKEKDKEYPYFALKIDNTDILLLDNNN